MSTSSSNKSESISRIYRLLNAFDFQASRFAACKGTIVSALVLIAGMYAIVLMDSTRVLPESIRWLSSIGVYVGFVVAGWMAGWNRFIQHPRSLRLANEIESLHPHFGERLSTSIELHEKSSSHLNGSDLFVAIVQRQALSELSRVDLPSLIKWRSLGRRLGILSFFATTIAILCCVPSLQFTKRIARAMIPFVDIDAPSSWELDVLSPEDSQTIVPSDQFLVFRLRATSIQRVEPLPKNAVLEWKESSENRKQVTSKMFPLQHEGSGKDVYSTQAPIGSRPLEYRFLFGDAKTQWRRVAPVARPRVDRFQWKMVFPSYSMVPSEIQTRDSGDLNVLRGSHLTLRIAVNQELAGASIVFENAESGQQKRFPFRSSDESESKAWIGSSPEVWECELLAESSGRFQVNLESKAMYSGETIKNTFSPWYRFDVVIDQPADVEWIVSGETLWSAPPRASEIWMVEPDDLVTLACEVQDNLPVSSVSVESSINDQDWSELSLPASKRVDADSDDKSPFRTKEVFSWDVASSKMAIDDLVLIRLKVVDRADNASYSIPLKFSIASRGFDKDRHKSLERRAEMIPVLERLHTNLSSKQEDVLKSIQQVRELGPRTENCLPILQEIREWSATASAIADEAQNKARELMSQVERCIDQNELELVSRSLARIQRERLGFVLKASDAMRFQERQSITDSSLEWTTQIHQFDCDRMASAIKMAGRDAGRLLEVYRSFISLEVQTALTKDITQLNEHQRKQLVVPNEREFSGLVRSQWVAARYWQLASDFANRMSRFVRPELAKRLPDLQVWMDISRQEIRDLCDSNVGESDKVKLLDRIRHDANELETRRWVYHLDGDVQWKTDGLRSELIGQSGSLAPLFEEFFKYHERRRAILSKDELSSQDLAVQNRYWIRNAESVSDSIQQLMDRRAIHQLRKCQDPLFVSDMGLASRAWNAIFTKWQSGTSNSLEPLSKELRDVYGAYRVLEATHEMAEAKLALVSLQAPERYDYTSLDGQLHHYRQWESVSARVELAHDWMRNAKFPLNVSDSYNSMRWSSSFESIQRKLASRRELSNTNVVSAARDMDALVRLWNENDLLALPTIEHARRTLEKYAPSVSELAKNTAEKTRELKQRTSDLDEAKESSQPKSRVQKELERAIADQQLRVNEQVRSLQDAIVEQAAKQDLLQQAQREIAKDSDRALDLVQGVTRKMNDALADAMNVESDLGSNSEFSKSSEHSSTEVQALGKAAMDAQDDAIKAFETIAKHFEETNARAKELSSSEESVPEKELQSLLSDHDSLDHQDAYQQAETLEKQWKESPEDAIRKLEEELRKNELMQSELSTIARKDRSSAAAELKRAADSEHRLKLRLENEDAAFFEAKRIRSDELHALADLAERTATKTLERASQMSQRATLFESHSSIQAVHSQLKEAIDDVKQITQETPSSAQKDAARLLESRLAKAASETQRLAQSLQKSVSRPVEKEEQKRLSKVNEAKNAQNSIRDELSHQITQLGNQWRESGKRAKQRYEQLVKEAESLERQRAKWFDGQKQNLAQENVREDLRRLNSQLEQSRARVKDAGEKEEMFDEFRTMAEKRFQSVSEKKKAQLDQPNPYAALAYEQLQNANLWLEDLVRKSRDVDSKSLEAKSAAPPESALSQVAKSQSEVKVDLGKIAEEVDRTARHEKRLGNDQESSSWTDQSYKIREMERGIVAKAENSLSDAARNAKLAEQKQSMPDPSGALSQKIERPTAATPLSELEQAERELSALAKEMNELVRTGSESIDVKTQVSSLTPSQNSQSVGSPPSQQSQGPESGSPSANSPSSGGAPQHNQMSKSTSGGSLQQRASEMAKMLDQLDRDLYAQQNPAETGDSKENGETDVSRSADPNAISNKVRNRKGNMSGIRQSAIENSAQQLASELNQARAEQLNRNTAGQTYIRNQKGAQSGLESKNSTRSLENAEDYFLPHSRSENGRDWGKLRAQRATDVLEGTRESFDPEFDQAIRAYYQAIGESPAKAEAR